MGEVNTQEFEMQILKMKADKLAQHTKELSERAKKGELKPKDLIEELKHDRKELVDCVTLQLGIEVVGPIAALRTVDTISSIDTLIFQLKLLVGLGL